MENPLLWLTIHHTWSSPKGNCAVYFIVHSCTANRFLSLKVALVAAMIIWAMTTIDGVLTAAQVTTAFQSIPTCPWSPMRRAGAQSVARWSRGLRSSMLRKYANDLDQTTDWLKKNPGMVVFPPWIIYFFTTLYRFNYQAHTLSYG